MLNKKAFALFEVILSILLIGILYSIVATSFSHSSLQQSKIENIKQSILSYRQDSTSTMYMIVFDSNATIREGVLGKEIPYNIPKDTKFYSYDIEGEDIKSSMYDIEADRYKEKIRFVYKIYPNGSSTPMVVKIQNKFYAYDTYSDEIGVFDDERKAKEYVTKLDFKSSMQEVIK